MRTSKYRGVSLHSKTGTWRAVIHTASNIQTYLGHFENEEDAAVAWDAAARIIKKLPRNFSQEEWEKIPDAIRNRATEDARRRLVEKLL